MTAAERERVVVVVPCFNEELSIAKVVADFRRALPGARVLVIDNLSVDATAIRAREAGAEVLRENRRGKGFALLRVRGRQGRGLLRHGGR